MKVYSSRCLPPKMNTPLRNNDFPDSDDARRYQMKSTLIILMVLLVMPVGSSAQECSPAAVDRLPGLSQSEFSKYYPNP